MGIRSAFNPLGTLPITVPASSGYTVSWTVSNIPYVNNAYTLPASWKIDGSTVLASDSNLHQGTTTKTSTQNGVDVYDVNMSYTVASGSDPGSHTVTTEDTNFSPSQVSGS